jgi:hypothetical protein
MSTLYPSVLGFILTVRRLINEPDYLVWWLKEIDCVFIASGLYFCKQNGIQLKLFTRLV